MIKIVEIVASAAVEQLVRIVVVAAAATAAVG